MPIGGCLPFPLQFWKRPRNLQSGDAGDADDSPSKSPKLTRMPHPSALSAVPMHSANRPPCRPARIGAAFVSAACRGERSWRRQTWSQPAERKGAAELQMGVWSFLKAGLFLLDRKGKPKEMNHRQSPIFNAHRVTSRQCPLSNR